MIKRRKNKLESQQAQLLQRTQFRSVWEALLNSINIRGLEDTQTATSLVIALRANPRTLTFRKPIKNLILSLLHWVCATQAH